MTGKFLFCQCHCMLLQSVFSHFDEKKNTNDSIPFQLVFVCKWFTCPVWPNHFEGNTHSIRGASVFISPMVSFKPPCHYFNVFLSSVICMCMCMYSDHDLSFHANGKPACIYHLVHPFNESLNILALKTSLDRSVLKFHSLLH